jgi:DNA-binding Xre family transcriptional regulator
MISFDPLWSTLKTKKMNKGDLQKLTGMSSTTIAKLSKDPNAVMLDVVDRICKGLKCQIYDVVETVEGRDEYSDG